MEDIQTLFREHANHFTIYVVEQKFVTGRGCDFFKSYWGKPNYIDTDKMAKNLIAKIHKWIDKKIPSIAEMIRICFSRFSPADLIDVVVAFTKLFATQEHQAAGPHVVDPIIIQEGKVLKIYINHIINLYRDSILTPAIIILLKDNDFGRARTVLSECPNGIYIRFIRNNGKTELHKVINTGAENIDGFIQSFSEQCFSTCSNTKHDILLNEEWAADSIVKQYAPRLLKYRANLLCDEKSEITQYLSDYISELESSLQSNSLPERDVFLKKNFLCVAKIFRVFCNDYGGKDITDALSLATETNNEILKACVYKYAYLFPNTSISQQENFLSKAYEIFVKNKMADNAIYCKNNKLIRQFDTEKIRAKDFADMIGEATSDVPGLVGMSHLFNNAGIAFMMSGQWEYSMEYFDKGMEYAKAPDRFVQKMGILCNKLIAKSYYGEKIELQEIEQAMRQISDGMVANNQLPFISARYAMNLLVTAARKNASWAKAILQEYNLHNLFQQGLMDNAIGSGQLLLQIEYLSQNFPEINLQTRYDTPKEIIHATGRRCNFIKDFGLNPFYFCTWL